MNGDFEVLPPGATRALRAFEKALPNCYCAHRQRNAVGGLLTVVACVAARLCTCDCRAALSPNDETCEI